MYLGYSTCTVPYDHYHYMATNQSTTLPVATHQMKWVLVFALALDPGPGSPPPRKATCTGNTSENRLKSGNLSVKKKKIDGMPSPSPKTNLVVPCKEASSFFLSLFLLLLLLPSSSSRGTGTGTGTR